MLSEDPATRYTLSLHELPVIDVTARHHRHDLLGVHCFKIAQWSFVVLQVAVEPPAVPTFNFSTCVNVTAWPDGMVR